MLCLGIESSCDECGLAIFKDGQLLDQVIASQVDLHALFGGVVPELASREHYRHIGPLFDLLLNRVGITAYDLDMIAVTRGPGLLGSLLVGTAFAKSLACSLDIPILGINHLHAHLLAIGLEYKPVFPAVGLLVSGGHTQLYLIEAADSFKQLGITLDDAAGEAFDKIGQILKLPYPAGKTIDMLSTRATVASTKLPRPYLDNSSLDFSFSGLKTAAAQILEQAPIPEGQELANFCASVNQTISDVLIHKLDRALEAYPECKAVWLAGGVAANSEIRKRAAALAASRDLAFLSPSPAFCTDNAAMIAFAGYQLGKMGYRHCIDFETIPRGKKIPDDMRKIE